MSSTHRIRKVSQLKHVAPSREAAIDTGSLYYTDATLKCEKCGSAVKRLVNGKCAFLPLPSRPVYGR